MNRFEAEVRAKGLTVFAHIDHAARAAGAGLCLRPTELLVFGAPKVGTPLMEATQTIGIDLPLKALVWLDETGVTWLSYNQPEWLAKRHALGPEISQSVTSMAVVLERMSGAAARSQPGGRSSTAE